MWKEVEEILEVYQDKKTGLWGIKDKDDKRAVLGLFDADVLFKEKEIAQQVCDIINKNAFIL